MGRHPRGSMGGFGGPGGVCGGDAPLLGVGLCSPEGLEVRLGRNGAILGNFGGSLGSMEVIGGH